MTFRSLSLNYFSFPCSLRIKRACRLFLAFLLYEPRSDMTFTVIIYLTNAFDLTICFILEHPGNGFMSSLVKMWDCVKLLIFLYLLFTVLAVLGICWLQCVLAVMTYLERRRKNTGRWSRKLTCFMWFGGFYQNCPRWWHCFKRLSVGDENKRFFCVGLFELFFLIFEHHCPSYFLLSFSSVCRWYKVDFLSTLDFSVK